VPLQADQESEKLSIFEKDKKLERGCFRTRVTTIADARRTGPFSLLFMRIAKCVRDVLVS